MKTTKKRLVLGIAGAVLLCVGATFTTLAATAEAPITDETMLANIEALSQEENEATCADYGYKKWSYDRPSVDSKYEGFRDCWCIERSGYDPIQCK